MSRVARSSFREAVLITLFLGLPLFLCLLGLGQMWSERETARRGRLERNLEDVLASFDRLVNTDTVVERLLRNLEDRVFVLNGRDNPDPLSRLRKLLPLYRRTFPGCFELLVLDGEGRPVPEFCEGPAPRAILRKLFVAASEDRRGNPRSWSDDEPMIRSLLGPLTPTRSFIPSRLLPSNAVDRHRMVYLGEPRSNGMMVVRVSQTPEWSGIGIRLHLERLRRISPLRGITLRLIDLHVAPPRKGEVMNRERVRDAVGGRKWVGQRLRELRVLSPRYQIQGVARLPRSRGTEREQEWAYRVGILGWLGLSLGIWTGFRLGWIPTLSVRGGMILAFAYAAGIPLLVLGGTARMWLQERRLVLEDQTHRTIGRALRTLDGRFPRQLQHYSLRVTNAMAGIALPGDGSIAGLPTELARVKRVLPWDLCRVYDPNGRIIFQDEAKAAFSRMAGAFDMLNTGFSRIMKMLQGAADSKDGSGEDAMDQMYGRLLGHLGRISAMELSGANYLSFLHPIHDERKWPRYMAHLVWTSQRMQLEFLRNELQRFSRQLDSTDLLAWNLEQPSRSLPQPFRHSSAVAGFLPRIRSQSRESRMRLEQPDGALLFTGIRGTFLGEFTLVAVSRDRSIRAELDLLAWKLGTASLLLLLVSIGIGMVVSKAFLEPVGSLESGIEALASRRFAARVPVLARDELGHLSGTFNAMMEGLADLEVAKTVQDALFPDAPLTVGRVEIFGRCCSASEIGGDYFDYTALDDRRLLFIIGDVAGHGVSAALVMAMAKALTADAGAEVTPISVLTSLNTVFERVLQGRKTMSCLAGLLDVTEGRLSICNGGHCFPYLIRAGQARQLEAVGMLVGMGRRWRSPKTYEFLLQPGDCLIGYTDALYESFDRVHGGALGFRKLEESLPGLRRGNARDTEAAIRDWHGAVAVSGRANDDLTLLVLQVREEVRE